MIDVDGRIDVSGVNGISGSGGGSGGSLSIVTDRFIGKGQLLCNGGNAVEGGGGGGGGSGGRVAIHCNETRFSGEISARGGSSLSEAGGPGTIYEKTGNGNKTKRSLEINNGGLRPLNDYLIGREQYDNGGKSWILVQSLDDLYFDEVRLLGGAHASFVSNVSENVVMEKFVGDKTGMLHIQDGDDISIKSAAIQFPSWFRVYEGGTLSLPSVVHLNRLGYRELFVDGTIGYMSEFRIGTGVSVFLGNMVRICYRESFCSWAVA